MTPLRLALVFAVAILTPISPLRVTLLPVVIAGMLVALRAVASAGERQARSRALTVVVALVMGAVVGKWALILVGLPILVRAVPLRRPTSTGSTASAAWLVPVADASMIALRPVLLVPRIATDLFACSGSTALSFLALLVLASLARPFVGVALVLGGLILVAADPAMGRRRSIASAPTLVLLFLMLSWMAWSGLVAAEFPLPLSPVRLVLVVALVTIPLLFSARRIGGAVAAVGFVVLLSLGPPPVRTAPQSSPLAWLHSGEQHGFHLSPPSRRVTLTVSGSDISDRRPGEVLGTVEGLGMDGNGWKRRIRVGAAADWGAFRPGQIYFTGNPLPARPAGAMEGDGRMSWRRGAGALVVEFPEPVTFVRVRAAEELSAAETLIVDSIEGERDGEKGAGLR